MKKDKKNKPRKEKRYTCPKLEKYKVDELLKDLDLEALAVKTSLGF